MALAAGLPVGASSSAQTPPPIEGITLPVFPGLAHIAQTVGLGETAAAVTNVLAFAPNDPGLALRPVLSGDDVPGLEPVAAMGRRLLPRGALAGVNGGFWLYNPSGEPNGYLALDGRLVSESQTQGAGPRGTVGIRADGSLVFDRLAQTLVLDSPALAAPLQVTGLNRNPSDAAPYPDGDQPVVVFTSDFGREAPVTSLSRPEGAELPVRALVVDGLVPRPAGTTGGVVAQVTTGAGGLPVPAGGAVVVAHGRAADALAAVETGTALTLAVRNHPLGTEPEAWTDVVHGIAAGPLLVRGGQRLDPSGWENEGFAPDVHSNVRAPRSAIAMTGDGRVLLLTVDGRQPGYSSGMTMAELTDLALSLGAVEALSLDGGGSTQLAIDGLLRNRPCCDPQVRGVANGLFVFHRYPFASSERLAGNGREATAAAVALAGWPDGAGTVLLAAGGTFADALAGGPLAATLDAPLLLAGEDLSATTRDALAALHPARVLILGGPSAVGPAVEASLAALGLPVQRLAGDGRTATAAVIAQAVGGSTGRVFLAGATAFPDALSATPAAALLGAPILLTEPDRLASAARGALLAAGANEVVIVGGPDAVGPGVVAELGALGLAVTRLSGDDRYGTSRAVNEWAATVLACCLDRSRLVVARGDALPDALSGGPLAAARAQLLVLVPPIDVLAHPDSAAFLAGAAADLDGVTLLGGHAVLSSYQQWQLDQLALPPPALTHDERVAGT